MEHQQFVRYKNLSHHFGDNMYVYDLYAFLTTKDQFETYSYCLELGRKSQYIFWLRALRVKTIKLAPQASFF